jgi:hypothetical protein
MKVISPLKIGVFGDSYASSIKYHQSKDWMEILNDTYDTVVSYGKSASNLYYSVEQFKKFSHLYDKNIFCVTNPSRIWAKHLKIEEKFKFITIQDPIQNKTLQRIKEKYKYNQDYVSELIKIFNATYIYMAFAQNQDQENYIHKLMIDDIVRHDPDVLLIPCFETSFVDQPVPYALYHIFEKENRVWRDIDLDQYHDKRNCHMTAENNVILAEKIVKAIETNQKVDLNINDFVNPTSESLAMYLKKL